jgi:NAD(P)-dependent dehydrogenase (short-subunit alcohol dehydrogenase family)
MSRVLFITGATGIAAAAARLSVIGGAKVFFTNLTSEAAESLQTELQALGGECDYHIGDLTVSSIADEAVGKCAARWGRIDGLFNVAGGSGRRFGDGPLHECSDEGWDATLALNLRPMFTVSRAVLRQMLAQSTDDHGIRGAILNMSSMLALSPEPEHFATHAYTASKGAIISLTRTMAAYYAAQKIRVNAIAPGLVRTPMSARAQSDPVIIDLMKTKQPLGEELIDAEDVARAALFLLGSDARRITGELLSVDAGWRFSK